MGKHKMSLRFLHTSDWQLGMTRHFLSEGAQERYSQARFDAIRALGRIAAEEHCRFVLVCGDAFESNQVDRKTVARALEALKDIPVPVYFLPGNHDPLNAASVYRSSIFVERKPDYVHLIENEHPIAVAEGVVIIGAGWMSKRPAANPIDEILNALPPADGVIRICAGHGAVDLLVPDSDSPGMIEVAAMERAINEGKIHYVALGDRHSAAKVGESERIWYSGTPESTDFAETNSGCALVVDVGEEQVAVKEVKVGQWRFIERARVDLNTGEDVETLRQWLENVENKERTVVRLRLVGSLSLSSHALLHGYLDVAEDVFGAIEVREDDLVVMPDDSDFADLAFSGFAGPTTERLRGKIGEGGDEAAAARDALTLLLRLARRTA
jgi:DNA repair exonuclease SbcCD nuclease subunit